jgi:histone acetyltransferase (RNA polymerase elongator complex component)
MPKRSIRIVKHIGPVPCVAACTFCNQQFTAPTSTLPRVKEATASLQEQFDKHKCKHTRDNVSEPSDVPSV